MAATNLGVGIESGDGGDYWMAAWLSWKSRRKGLKAADSQNRHAPLLEEDCCHERPKWSALRDKLLWFHPSTWWGILQIVGRSPYADFTVQEFMRHALALLLPVLIMGLLHSILDGHLLASTILSPWALLAAHNTASDVRQVISRVRTYNKLRKPLLDEARWALQTRCNDGKAFRLRRADVYLPSTFSHPNQALLFYPGATVPQEAYSEILSYLADRCNLVVVVASCEPLRLAEPNPREARRIMRQVEDKVKISSPRLQWCIGGHSLGSFAAMKIAAQLDPKCLIMWASGPYPNERTSLAGFNELPVLVVQGSWDNACRYTLEELEGFFNDLPAHAKVQIIDDVTHDGFSTYTPNPEYDGTTNVSRKIQHERIVEATARFLEEEDLI